MPTTHRAPRPWPKAALAAVPTLCPNRRKSRRGRARGLGCGGRAARRRRRSAASLHSQAPGGVVRERFGLSVCRETIRAAMHRIALSWKKAKKLLGRADPEQRRPFIDRLPDLLAERNATATSWSILMRLTFTKTPILVMAGAPAASGCGWPPARPGSRPRCRSMVSISKKRASSGCGPMPAPTESTR